MKKALIYIVVFLVYGFVVRKITTMESYKENFELVQKQSKVIDSLKEEVDYMNSTLDYQDWIINQAKDKYPKQMNKIIEDSE